MPPPTPSSVLLVTGLSGAGKTSALKILEDLGYEVVDNVPLDLLPQLVIREADATAPARPLAVGLDSRTRGFSAEGLRARLPDLRRGGGEIRLLFLHADDEVLERRFTETRRRHPLAEATPVAAGIARERALLAPLCESADLLVDTSDLRPPDLRHLLTGLFHRERAADLVITVLSFSYRKGLPREADLVFDVRFLRNPHYEEKLRPGSGRDAAVAAYIEGDPVFAEVFHRLWELLAMLLPGYRREGKSYLTVAIGCTGGQHRSVFVAEQLAARMQAAGYAATARHRDLPDRGGSLRPAV